MPTKNFYFLKISYLESPNGPRRTAVFYPECEAKDFEKEADKITRRMGFEAEVVSVTKLS